MGYAKPGMKRALKQQSQDSVALLFSALLTVGVASRWGAILLRVAAEMVSRNS
jgi:hypothetical protein